MPAPPPEPPVFPGELGFGFAPAPPPPADVIVENTEFPPELPGPEGTPGCAAPPLPTVIGNDVAVTVILFGADGYPSNGLAV